jgi:hypothetical protein
MNRSRQRILTAMAGASIVLGSAVAATPASAATSVRPMSSWIGTCYTWTDGVSFGGWCDGNGPNWTYRTTGGCYNGHSYRTSGVSRWAGDRRGSYGYCNTNGGYYVEGSGGINVYDNGVFRFSATI